MPKHPPTLSWLERARSHYVVSLCKSYIQADEGVALGENYTTAELEELLKHWACFEHVYLPLTWWSWLHDYAVGYVYQGERDIPRRTLTSMCERGQLPAIKVGGRWYVDVAVYW